MDSVENVANWDFIRPFKARGWILWRQPWTDALLHGPGVTLILVKIRERAMPEILFVHGTGVRLVSYDITLSLVRRKAKKYLNGVRVHQCLWGDPCGAKLNISGASIPTYDETPAHALSESEAEQIDQATWRMLVEDSLFELRLLQDRPAPRRELGPDEMRPGEISFHLLQNLHPGADFSRLLDDTGIEPYWTSSHNAIASSLELKQILTAANRDPREVSGALARALIACLIRCAMEDGHPGISGETRTFLVDFLIPDLGKQALAPFDWVTRPLLGMAKAVGTYKGRRERRALTDGASPVAGDIILYQARGEAIRKFIRDRIMDFDSELIVIAHSLGGIAVVDLLIQEDLRNRVRGLVTVGSQAPFLYEINALVSLGCGQQLPPHFPQKWLNIWDPNDFLSYIGAEVFGPQSVEDHMVRSRVPFPDSHSAYWDQEAVWTKIRSFFS
jgi:hypothetical protein